MKCPFCGFENDKVVDSRESKEADSIRRRRECLKCEKRFTTYERIDEIPYMVVKKDGRREAFDRKKIVEVLKTACQKRPVGSEQIEELVTGVERSLQELGEKEIRTNLIGERVMERLRALDPVAFVRFASVYRAFQDVGEFMSELQGLARREPPAASGEMARPAGLAEPAGSGSQRR